MNPVEIEEAITELVSQPFDKDEFPFAFLRAFGNKETTIKRLRSGSTNKSDVGGVLQRTNIHMAVAEPGQVAQTLAQLRESPASTRGKVRFLLATDGSELEAENLENGETLACAYTDVPDHFGFFLSLAGISTVKQITDNAFDIRATSRLNKLYVELLRDNPDWGVGEQRHELNHFFARLIFCFFAEDTDIFNGEALFTETVETMSARDSSDTHSVIRELFRSMNTKPEHREAEGIPRWASGFPYVNGELFSGTIQVPKFSRIARAHLRQIGNLDWTQINPDIFGSMIQAVADEEERGSLGMHYTSVPNILKVLNPLFLDDLNEKLEAAGDNSRKLLNLRNRIARIRVFDPACGSGNFLVIAYKQMREIENMINERRGEPGRKSDIPLTNFRGIELRDFSAEIARLALIIAEYQCDVSYRGQKQALQEFLPLDAENWITQGNALRLDWLSICHPTETKVKHRSNDLFEEVQQTEIDFENEGGETYICGNPPYLGSKWQTADQKADLSSIFGKRVKNWKSLDYVSGWFMKAADYGLHTPTATAFVSTNSICQGQQVPILWPEIFSTGHEIAFAHTSFKWANLASQNAGVTVVIVGMAKNLGKLRRLFELGASGEIIVKDVPNINPYLVPADTIFVSSRSKPNNKQLATMQFGNHPYYGSALIFAREEANLIADEYPGVEQYVRPFYGSTEFIKSTPRACLWITDEQAEVAQKLAPIAERVTLVRKSRIAASNDLSAQKLAATPWRFREQSLPNQHTIIVPRVSSENRPYLPVGLLEPWCVVQEKAFAMYDAPLWNIALIASRLHWVWIGTVCVRMRTDFSYSNTLGWNTFPVPILTQKNEKDLTVCAEEILLAREANFPATIADLYKPESMPDSLRAAHEKNDEVLERIYIGRRFRNDTERLKKLFELYTQIAAKKTASAQGGK